MGYLLLYGERVLEQLLHFLEAIKVRISFTFLLFFVFNFIYLGGKMGKR